MKPGGPDRFHKTSRTGATGPGKMCRRTLGRITVTPGPRMPEELPAETDDLGRNVLSGGGGGGRYVWAKSSAWTGGSQGRIHSLAACTPLALTYRLVTLNRNTLQHPLKNTPTLFITLGPYPYHSWLLRGKNSTGERNP